MADVNTERASGTGGAFRLPLLFRLVLLCAVISALSTGIALLAQDQSLSVDLEQAARNRLVGAARAADRLIDNHLEAFLSRFEAISGTPQFRALLEIDDPPTLEHYARELLETQGASRILFLDREGKVVAGAGDVTIDPESVPAARSGLLHHGGELYAAASVTLKTGEFAVGRLIAVEKVTRKVIRDWSELCGAQIVINRPQDAPENVIAAPVRQRAGLQVWVETSLDAEREALAHARENLLTAGVLALTAALIVSFLLSKSLIRPILQLKEAVVRVGEGDFNVDLHSDRGDEIGDVARAFGVMTQAIRQMVGQLSDAADRIESTAGEISSIAETVTKVTVDQIEGIRQAAGSIEGVKTQVTGIAATAANSEKVLNVYIEGSSRSFRELGVTGEELNSNATILSEKVDHVTGFIKQMTQNAKLLAENSEHLAQAADDTSSSMERSVATARTVNADALETVRLSREMVSSSERGRERVSQTIRGMEEIRAATEAAQEVMRTLGESVMQIGTIVNLIDDVSDETNLLALNAEIIAAQAGEQGRAFSVVAREINALAGRVMAGTKEIRGLVSSTQNESTNVMKAIERGFERVRSGVELAEGAGVALEEITRAARDSGTKMEGVMAALAGQIDGAEHVVALMKNVQAEVEQIRQASREQDEGSEAILGGCGAMQAVADTVKRATSEQSVTVARIGESVKTIQEKVGEINTALQAQSSECRNAAEFLKSVHLRTSANEEAAQKMDEAMQKLRRHADTLRGDVGRFRN